MRISDGSSDVCSSDLPETRTISGSPTDWRNRARAWLIADCVRPSRFAVRVTLRCSMSVSNMRRRLRSSSFMNDVHISSAKKSFDFFSAPHYRTFASEDDNYEDIKRDQNVTEF